MNKALFAMPSLRVGGPFAIGLAAAALGAIYVVSTLLTPLYPLYERAFGFGELMVTEIYATYLIGNLLVLFVLGRLSDRIGRRKVAVAALLIAAASTLVLLAARSAAALFVGRALSGLATGLGTGALAAWIVELDPKHDRQRAAVVASAGNLAGLALGGLLGGWAGRSMRAPLRTGFVINLVLLTLLALPLFLLRETVERRTRAWSELSLQFRLGVPKELRLRFVAPAAIAVALFALVGFYGSLVPGLLARRLHEHNVAVLGGIIGLLYGGAGAVVALFSRTEAKRAVRAAVVLLFLALALLVGAELAASFALLLGATLASGAALGLGYRGSLQAINDMAPADRRAELVSSYLLCTYSANALPALGVGLLSRVVSPELAHFILAGVLALLGVIALVAGGMAERRAQAAA